MSCHRCKSKDSIIKLRRCSHKFCEKCLYYYIKEHFNCKIKCPRSRCNEYLRDGEIRKFLSVSDENKYERLCVNANFSKCLTKFCTYVYSTDGDRLCFSCPECDQPNCVTCNKRHKPDECNSICQKSEVQRDNEARSVLENKRVYELHDYDAEHDLIPAHEGFECPFCSEFILPKSGVMLRCGCYHCKSCLFEIYTEKQYINQLGCPTCSIEFSEIEKKVIIGLNRLNKMTSKGIEPLLSHCKGPDCDYIWYTKKISGVIVCSNCNKVNCLSCNDIHEGMTCEQFKQTPLWLNEKNFKKMMKSHKQVTCYSCKTWLVHGGRCGAMFCKNCNVQTCLFTGLKVGPEGCNCTSSAPCHPKCLYGCIPD